MKGRMSTSSFQTNTQGKHGANLKINHSWCIKLTRQVSYLIPKPITAPWLYFARDFLSNHRSNVRSRTNTIFSRSAFLERKLGVLVLSSLFMWGGILPIKNDSEWQSGFGDFLFSSFRWSRVAYFPLFTSFRSLIGNPSFLSFVLFLIFIFLFFFPSSRERKEQKSPSIKSPPTHIFLPCCVSVWDYLAMSTDHRCR